MLTKYIENYKLRKQYSKDGRIPFFKLAYNFLPKEKDAVVLDIGCGDAEFAAGVNLAEKYNNLHLLDSNPETINKLRQQYKNVMHYEAPDRLEFEDASVDYIHLSHLVEHLEYQKLYAFMKELDRITAPGGVLVISTPLLWWRFYNDLSHVKPYNPEVFIHYLCDKKSERSAGAISSIYTVENLTFRYRALPIPDGGWTSQHLVVDVCMQIAKRITAALGFRYQEKNGYTLVLRKQS